MKAINCGVQSERRRRWELTEDDGGGRAACVCKMIGEIKFGPKLVI